MKPKKDLSILSKISMKNKMAFYVMGQKGFHVLRQFIAMFNNESLEYVVSSRDRHVKEDYYDEINSLCTTHSIPFYNKNETLRSYAYTLLAVGWRWLIPLEDSRVIIFHDSILPRYRGFNPLVSCLINKERTIGVTALFAANDYDRGDIIDQEITNIDYPITIYDAINKTIPLYVTLVNRLSNQILNENEIASYPQNEDAATYSLWRDDDDYAINWAMDAEYIRRFIDAVGYPYEGASSYISNRKIRIIEAMVLADVRIENRVHGKVIFISEGCPVVVCGKGLIKLLKVIDDATGDSMLPFNKFRVRLK